MSTRRFVLSLSLSKIDYAPSFHTIVSVFLMPAKLQYVHAFLCFTLTNLLWRNLIRRQIFIKARMASFAGCVNDLPLHYKISFNHEKIRLIVDKNRCCWKTPCFRFSDDNRISGTIFISEEICKGIYSNVSMGIIRFTLCLRFSGLAEWLLINVNAIFNRAIYWMIRSQSRQVGKYNSALLWSSGWWIVDEHVVVNEATAFAVEVAPAAVFGTPKAIRRKFCGRKDHYRAWKKMNIFISVLNNTTTTHHLKEEIRTSYWVPRSRLFYLSGDRKGWSYTSPGGGLVLL